MKNQAGNAEVNSDNSQAGASSSRRVDNTAPNLGLAEPIASRRLSAPGGSPARGMNYRLEAAWPAPSEVLQQEVVHFWLSESALPDEVSAQARAPQLLVVSRDSNGQVAGVSTAVRTFVPLLGFECFYYRTFVGRAHRVRGLRGNELVWRIGAESYRLLDERFRRGCDPGVLGLYAEIESASLMASRKEAVWREYGMNVVYIGRTQDGRHLRVWYFDGARIP
jgi:hypothetical protein